MTITTDTILMTAKLLGAMGVLIGSIIVVYKIIERGKRQSKMIDAIRREQQVLCRVLLACLRGLQAQGCNGPVTAAVKELETHLNIKAHDKEV